MGILPYWLGNKHCAENMHFTAYLLVSSMIQQPKQQCLADCPQSRLVVPCLCDSCLLFQISSLTVVKSTLAIPCMSLELCKLHCLFLNCFQLFFLVSNSQILQEESHLIKRQNTISKLQVLPETVRFHESHLLKLQHGTHRDTPSEHPRAHGICVQCMNTVQLIYHVHRVHYTLFESI